MAEITLVRDADIPWEEPPAEFRAKYKEGDLGLRFKRVLPSAPGQANVQLTEYRPGHFEPPHSHPEDEIIHVLSGSIFFGRDELGAGDTLFVPKDKVYSLRTGESGVAFLRVGLG